MKKRYLFSVYLVLISAVILSPAAQKKNLPKDLAPQYRTWLEEEVVYIITPKEKEVFLQLESDREREIFVQAFWKQRDPNPTTPQNEFKEEHYKRINYANNWFGKESPVPGWRSAMGRIYITLGPPQSIDRFENLTEVYPVVIWFYNGMGEYGLPDSFNVVFFKKDVSTEFELYTPIKYGPQQLLIHYQGDQAKYENAYNKLLEIQPEIAAVSLSLIPSEAVMGSTLSIASEILIGSKIPAAPYQKVKDAYAEKLLAYKDIVEVDYTANYIDNDALVRVAADSSGVYFVHYCLEPKRLTFEQLSGKFFSNLEVNGKISDTKGDVIYQFDRTLPIELNKDQIDKIKAKLFSYQDMFPLIPGHYKFDLLLKNTVSKEFTSAEAEITIPEAASFVMSPLILANRMDLESQYRGKSKPFLLGGVQYTPSPRNDFSTQDNLYLYFQISGLPQALKETAKVEYAILKETERVLSVTRVLQDYPDPANISETFSLASLPPAYYTISVSLLGVDGRPILSEQSNFSVSASPYLPRPWVLSVPRPGSGDPSYLNILGNQFLMKKDTVQARALLEESYQKNPASPKFALDYCRVLFVAKEYRAVARVAAPFIKEQKRPEFLELVGQSSQALGELAEAIAYYKAYLAHYGTNILILNAIGQCYLQSGNTQEALVAWEKSLEINPNQEDLKEQVKSLKEKK